MGYVAGALLLALLFAGCGSSVSFPSEGMLGQIEDICQNDYGMKVAARRSGSTLGILHIMDSLVNEKGDSVTEEFREKIGNLILTSTRAALSTDVPVDFVLVVMRGREDQNQIQIVRYIVDIKRAQTEALSMDESMSRSLWGQSKITPAEFDEDRFELKEITLPEFLTQQVTQRLRFEQSEEETEEAQILPKEIIDGQYVDTAEGKSFEFSMISFIQKAPEVNVMRVFRMVNTVLSGYGFDDFDRIVIKDLLSRKLLYVDRTTQDKFKHHKLTEDELLAKGLRDDLNEPDRLRNALEVFGFTMQ
jgi:hypothetical protein